MTAQYASREKNNVPVLAGCAAVQQRETVVDNSVEAVALMLTAVRAAAKDCGNETVLPQVQRVYVPKGLWGYGDPARLLADAIGANSATTVLADFGILQQTLIGDACERIAAGEIECALVVGGEAKFRQLQASIQGIFAAETAQQAVPDVFMQPEAEMCLPAEEAAGLLMPVGFYAIIESALRFARGETPEQNRDRLARMYSRFSEIAAANPHSWKRDVLAPEAIRDVVGKNRMLALPYTRMHNSEWNVDQAAALLLCSEAFADRHHIAPQKRIYPLVSTESNHMVCLAQRKYLYRSTGAEEALQAAIQHAWLSVGDIELLDLYSCFPAAVQIFANALGADGSMRDLTVTGGMAAAGGPLNNYVLQATCRMVELLREKSQAEQRAVNGLVSSVSGMISKQGYGIWSSTKPERNFSFIDVSGTVAGLAKVLPVLDSYHGAATIIGGTVLYAGEQPSRAIVIAETDNGERVVAYSEDATVMQRMLAAEYCGKVVQIAGNLFSL